MTRRIPQFFCACGCGAVFPATRPDRIYYARPCRLRVSNARLTQRRRVAAAQRAIAKAREMLATHQETP